MAKRPRRSGGVHGNTISAKITGDAVALPDGFSPAKAHKHETSFTSTRRAIYRGKKISVRTTYRIEIDDEPLTVHTMVLDDGTVHCHGLPNYAFSSALDLTRALIDTSALIAKPKDEIGKATKMHKGGRK